MRNFHTSMKTTASPEKIWEIWTHVPEWPTWDPHVEHATINGVFQEGQTGMVKAHSMPEVEYYLSGVKEHRSFTIHILLPLKTELEHWHIIADDKPGVFEITHGVRTRGLLSWIFAITMGAKYRKALPNIMDTLRAQAGDDTPRPVEESESKKQEQQSKGDDQDKTSHEESSQESRDSEHATTDQETETQHHQEDTETDNTADANKHTS